MKSKIIIAIGVLLFALMIGFFVWDSTDPYSLEDSVAESEVIADAALTSDGDRLYLNMTTEQNARQNDRYCITTTSGDVTTTTCYDDWHDVEVSTVSVVKKGNGFFAEDEQIGSAKVSNGESASVAVPWEEGTYVVYITSERAWATTLTIHISEEDGSYEVTGSNWNNEV